MNKKEKIKELFFEKKYKQNEIAEELNTSTQYISKVLQNDSRYIDEKEKRKSKSKDKNRKDTINYMKKKRKSICSDYDILKKMHDQASHELSGGRSIISNRAFWEWNKSAYKYNKRKKCYEFDTKLTRSYAVPRYIK